MQGKLWGTSKKVVGGILLFCVIAIAGSVGKQLAHEWMKPSDKEILAKLVAQAVQKVNAKTPMTIDEITRLDRAEAVEGYKMRMYHTLLNYETYAKGFNLKQAQVLITKDICAKQTKDSPLRLGFVWEYVYKQESGAEVGRFEIAKKDCLGI
jgi:hypothetical protein